MPLKYDIFGSVNKEPPQLTTARSILGVGRNADVDRIKKQYHKYAKLWHPDMHDKKPTEEEANAKMELYTRSYNILTDPVARNEEEQKFQEALKQPFLIGNRIFCLGSLYGTRIYIPQGSTATQNPSRLLTGNVSQENCRPQKHYTIYGIRHSILESDLSDLLFLFYSGKDTNELHEGFNKKDQGGLDDLPWIINNDRASDHFLKRELKQAAFRMQEASRSCPGNIILIYRHGVCLESYAAERRQHKEKWKDLVSVSIELYKSCLQKLEGRKVWEEIEYLGDKKEALVEKPESQLTILMQLADAYAELGYNRESKRLWKRIKTIDPDCYEARVKSKNIVLSFPINTARVLGLLPK
jgi:curved DNA-binding protein CbpA